MTRTRESHDFSSDRAAVRWMLGALVAASVTGALACGAADSAAPPSASLTGALSASAQVDAEAGTMTLLGVDVSVPAGAPGEALLAELAPGDITRVEGEPDGLGGVRATRVATRDGSLSHAEIEGFVDAFDAAAGTLTVFGLEIGTDALTDFRDDDDRPISADAFFARLQVGDRVEIKGAPAGTDQTGFSIADRVELEDARNDGRDERDDPLRITAAIAAPEDVDPDAGTLRLLNVTIRVDPATHIEDDDDLPGSALSDLMAGDFLEVRGISDGAGGILANRLEREEDADDEAEIQGFLEAFDATAGTLTILGNTVATDSRTEFERGAQWLTAETFFAEVRVGDLLKLKGPDGADPSRLVLADEVEFEEADDDFRSDPRDDDDDDSDGPDNDDSNDDDD